MQIKYLSCKKISEMTGMSLRTVWGWCNSGKLKASRPGGREYVIKEEDFFSFMESDNRKEKGAENHDNKNAD